MQVVAVLRKVQGVSVVGFTWYGLIDQIDWDIQLHEIKGKVTPNGLSTLDRQPQPVAAAFRDLATHYGDLPVLQDFPIGSMRGPLSEPWLEDAINAAV